VVVQRHQLGAFCDALGAQSRFGFCLVPVPGVLPPRPALPKNLRMPMPGNAATGLNQVFFLKLSLRKNTVT